MNKLRKKIFWVLFIILSLFFVSILIIFNSQHYIREKRNIEQNLSRMDIRFEKKPITDEKAFEPGSVNDNNDIPKEEDQRRFMDATIYTILLDDSGIKEIISHTEDGLITSNIQEIVTEIINDNEIDTTFIGCLYMSDYAYKYEVNHYITLVDISDVKKLLISSLEISVILLVLGEIIIILISRMLSNWIIKPVEISFNKQKQFIADASHELKTPLSVIMACAETLENNHDDKWLKNIKTESERMNKLITNLLDLAKLEQDVNQELYEEVNLSKVVEKTILTFESLAYEKKIKLEYNVDENVVFRCIEEDIRRLIIILLDNAIKHSPKKGQIIVNLRSSKDEIILEVMNDGLPIPKGEEEKIFERFYRGDKSRNRDDNRYGLGLAIAKCIVLNHNGKISAFSNDKYTVFKTILKNKNIK